MKNLKTLLLKKELIILHEEFSIKVEKLLGENICEISADGSTHTKEELCEWLKNKPSESRWEIKKFGVEELADDLGLATYWAKMLAPRVSESNGAIHSSLWKKNTKGAWQMVFHQATKVS